MRHFWKGFNKTKSSPPVRYRKCVIILYWKPEDDKSLSVKDKIKKLSLKYPSVAVKIVNIKKDPLKPIRHKVLSTPTILLLKDGREVERLLEGDGADLIERLFRKAHA
jgi:thioredoxin-like negative regulator of GroEL